MFKYFLLLLGLEKRKIIIKSPMIMDYPVKEPHGINDIPQKLERIKSINSINQINRLHRTLLKLEEKCNMKVAEKYLIGFLEQKGLNSYQDYIDSLI